MTAKSPPIGLTHKRTLNVDESVMVPELPVAVGRLTDMPPVFATAYMVAFVEGTCVEALRPYLAAHQHSVGIRIDMNHKAATPVGMTVTADVELVAVAGRRLTFRAVCRDDAEIIGEGVHERAIIDQPKFQARVDEKAKKRRGS